VRFDLHHLLGLRHAGPAVQNSGANEMKKLLNIDQNAKTVKGQIKGFLTAVLYLAPYKSSGFNVCPMAELAGCWKGCLNTAGRGGISKGSKRFRTPAGLLPDNAIQRARIARTQLFVNDQDEFFRRLYQEIRAFIRKAERMNLTPVIRLNGTSDILWEKLPCKVSDNKRGIHCIFTNIFAVFPEIQFYDYTKIAKRFYRELPSNYYICLSYSEASPVYAARCWKARQETGCSLVTVYRDKDAISHARMIAEECKQWFVDGDANDLRFLDRAGSLVALKAKGKARKDTSGFVIGMEELA
jgi:hypothetical protein